MALAGASAHMTYSRLLLISLSYQRLFLTYTKLLSPCTSPVGGGCTPLRETTCPSPTKTAQLTHRCLSVRSVGLVWAPAGGDSAAMHLPWWSSTLLPSQAHQANRPNAVPRLLLSTARPAVQHGRPPWLGQLHPRQRRRRREALPPVGAAASEGFIATGAGIFPVDGGRWAPLLARTTKAKANLKLLALCTGA